MIHSSIHLQIFSAQAAAALTIVVAVPMAGVVAVAIDIIPGEAFQYLIYILRAGCIFILASIAFCHILFLIGWAKGWKDPNLTPEEILNRLFGFDKK